MAWVIASDRLLRWLCWTLIVFAVATAVMQLALIRTYGRLRYRTDTDLVARLEIIRADDGKAKFLSLGSPFGSGVSTWSAPVGSVRVRLAPKGGAA